MPELKNYKLFISHSWTYSDAYEKLCKLLDNASNFDYSNYSIPKDDPVHTRGSDYILYSAIKQKMCFCNVILIMAGVYSSYSKWIDKEIRIANNEFSSRKPIIAIEPWGSERTSKVVKDNAAITVAWNTSSIVDAIRRHAI
ncbi:MAG: TIR domain-containing protein [Planctomycetaceae bacterium]|nr:TIR domain-containing protein [Planctomycetaceae bacterium]